jgi:hypothetical protein
VFTAVYDEMGAKPLAAAAAEGLATTLLRAVVSFPTRPSQAWPLTKSVGAGGAGTACQEPVCVPPLDLLALLDTVKHTDK